MYSRLPSKTLDLLVKMLEKDPAKRISAEGALVHPYFCSNMDLEMETKMGREVSSRVGETGTKGEKVPFEAVRRANSYLFE
jgi:serine/threonine protein kinase